MPITNLDGKVALVTGGAGGIGCGICEVLAEHGARVIVGYHSSREQAAALADRLPNRVCRAVPAACRLERPAMRRPPAG